MHDIDTLIELYDPKTHLYNALGVMLFRPRRVVFLIPEHSSLIYDKYKDAYRRVWKSHGCLPEETISVLTGTSNILALSETVMQFCGENTVLDIEGGTPELYLASGYACAKYQSGVRCVRVDFIDEKMTEYIYSGGEASSSVRAFTAEELSRITLSVSESIEIYGGEITRDAYTELTSAGMKKEDIIKESRLLWETVHGSVGRDWNEIIPEKIHSSYGEDMMVYTDSEDRRWSSVNRVIDKLCGVGLLFREYESGKRIYYRCSSPLVFSCMRKAGEALELYTLGLALSIDGVSDARSGVSISFSEADGASENEVDCIYVRGSTPVFVSCKNGAVSSDELYKFHTVSEQFGGNEKISLLVAPNFTKNDKKSQNLIDRAEVYKISFVTEFDGRSHDEMAELLREKTDARKKRLK